MLLGFIKIFIGFIVLIYASYSDLKNRIVPNKSWLIIYPVVIVTGILSFYLELDLQNIAISLLSILIAVGMGILCFYSGFLGGGDVKTFIAISILCPTFVFNSKSLFYPFLPLSTLVNSLFLLLIINFCLFLQNLFRIIKNEKIFEGLEHEALWKKLYAMFIGYKIRGKCNWKFFRVIEENIGKKKIFKFYNLETKFNISNTEIWIAPVIPFIALMFFGFLTSLFFGDFFTFLVKNVLTL